jgi:phosphatidate cytidylyltransferase
VSAPEAPRTSETPTSKRSWTDLGPRIVSALVLVLIAVVALYFGGYIFAALVGAVFAGCYREWDRMVTLKPLTTTGGVLIGLVALAALLYPLLGPLATLGVAAAAAVIALFGERPAGIWRAGGLLFFGLVLVAILAMRGPSYEGMLLGFFLAAVIWSTDTGAFFTGRQIGGERLAPDISPSKTWSGAIGGLALGTLAGLVAWLIIAPASPWWIGLALAAMVSLLGQVGDLSESFIKRRFRIKDSGDIIPGHGGLMDRLDSLTFGVLFVFAVGWMRGGIDGVASGFLNW